MLYAVCWVLYAVCQGCSLIFGWRATFKTAMSPRSTEDDDDDEDDDGDDEDDDDKSLSMRFICTFMQFVY